MKTIDRYILKESCAYIFLCLAAFTSLLLVLRMLKFSDLIINKGVNLKDVGLVFSALIPTFLEFAIPMSTLLGVMLCIARLSGDSEIVVIKASGISIFQLIKTCVIVGSCMLAFALVISLTLRPWGYRTLSETLYRIARDKTTVGLQDGIFQKLGVLTLYAEHIEHDSGLLSNVLIDDKRAPKKNLTGNNPIVDSDNTEENNVTRKIIFAKKGYIEADNAKQQIRIKLQKGEIHEHSDQNYTHTRFDKNDIILGMEDLYDPDAERGDVKFRELKLSSLKETAKEYQLQLDDPQKSGLEILELEKNLRSLKLEHTRRYSFPFSCFLLPFISLALGIQAPRAHKTWGTSMSVILALVVFIFYFALLSAGLTLGEKGILSPFIAMWLPNLALIIIASILVYYLGIERWQSIHDPIQTFFDFFGKFRKNKK